MIRVTEPSAVGHNRDGSVRFGQTAQGRPLIVSFLGDGNESPRVLIVAGQHGDEPLGRLAAGRLIEQGRDLAVACGLQLAVVSDANPDGAVSRTRRTAQDVDMNRDHQLLRASETRALHKLVRTWAPHAIVDVHTYPPRRRHLLEQQLVYCHDIMLDVPNNPSLCLATSLEERLGGIAEINDRLARLRIRSTRYTLNRTNRVRHSTPDIADARNGLALRYGVPTLLLEGRQPTGGESSHRAAACLETGLHEILRWVNKRRTLFGAALTTHRPTLAIRSRYEKSKFAHRMVFADARDGSLRQTLLAAPYTPRVRPNGNVTVPDGYAVARHRSKLLRVLRRHGFRHIPFIPARYGRAESYHIRAVRPSRRNRRAPRKVQLTTRQLRPRPGDYVFFPAVGHAAHALAVYLEPASKYALHRHPEVDLPLVAGEDYPVLRLYRT